MASPLVQGWLYATVPLDNPQGESGTGFLVLREIAPNQGRVFIVTNKHVICRDSAMRSSTPYIRCHFNTKEADGSAGIVSGELPLSNPD